MHDHAPELQQEPAAKPKAAAPAGPGGMLGLQRAVGNRAFSASLQREPALQREDPPGGAAAGGGTSATPAPGDAGGAAGSAGTLGDPGGATSVNGATVTVNSNGIATITAPMITFNAAMTTASGVLKAETLIADSVVAASYTPGAGNTQ